MSSECAGESALKRNVSRRMLIQTACLLAGGLAAPASAHASAKVTQQAAHYQPSPKRGAECASCQHFQAPGSCNLVDGPISPSGWCAFFAPRPR